MHDEKMAQPKEQGEKPSLAQTGDGPKFQRNGNQRIEEEKEIGGPKEVFRDGRDDQKTRFNQQLVRPALRHVEIVLCIRHSLHRFE